MPGLMRVQVLWDRTDQPAADTAVSVLHFVLPIAPPTATDWNAFIDAWTTFHLAIDQYQRDVVHQSMLRFYNVPPGPNPEVGDPVHVDTVNRTGNSTATLCPPQVACSITMETAVRRRWGRIYLPFINISQLAPEGRWNSAFVTTVANAYHDFCEAMALTGRGLAVHRRTDGTYQLVNNIRVDNVPDVIRRRRFAVPTQRELRSISD